MADIASMKWSTSDRDSVSVVLTDGRKLFGNWPANQTYWHDIILAWLQSGGVIEAEDPPLPPRTAGEEFDQDNVITKRQFKAALLALNEAGAFNGGAGSLPNAQVRQAIIDKM